MGFVSKLEEIRARARQHIEDGAVTKDYPLDRNQVIGALNEALATEIVCVLRYQFHYFMATGIHSKAIAEEFQEHAEEEQKHAGKIAARIKQLGGKPEMNPISVAKASYTEYKEGVSLADMIREDLVAERIVIETYRELARFFGQKDPVSRLLVEEILEEEEEHADELADLLFAVEPENIEVSSRLYFKDEIPGESDAGQYIKAAAAVKHVAKKAARR
ncbi:MAG: bacterioferritin [Blastocatellia bacterium]|nr:bacterioferritin [Blastocatellia bacterium]